MPNKPSVHFQNPIEICRNRGKIDTPNAHVRARSLFRLDTGT